jgi:hypothetical protein
MGNNWTPNNFSVAAGSGNDSLRDVPMNYYSPDNGLGGEVIGNYATLNPVDVMSAVTLTNGNLDVSGGDNIRGTVGCSTSGKWYFEYTKTNAAAGGYYGHVGLFASTCAISSLTNGTMLYRGDGNYYENDTLITTFSSYTTNDVIGVAVDVGAGNVSFYKNNVLQGTRSFVSQISSSQAVPGGRNNTGQTATYNFGQRPFAYTAPLGFKALCTQNLSAPRIGNVAVAQANDYFNAVTYPGTGSSLSVTGTGFQPDLVWIKSRSQSTDHALYDAVRGVQKQLESNTQTDETTETTGLTAFDADGFTVGALAQVNTNTATYVAWQWNAGGSTVTNTSGSITSSVRASQTAGFSVVTYTGTSANATVGHGLGVAPNMVICKSRGTAGTNWGVWHSSLTSYAYYLLLNTTAGQATAANAMQALPSSTLLSLGASSIFNDSAAMVAYCFAAVPGFSAFGSYTGNGSADGPFVYLGFRPAFVLTKRSDSTSNWILTDRLRQNPYNSITAAGLLYPNLTNTESGTGDWMDFVSNGFKLRGIFTDANASGGTFIYAAFAEIPFQFANAR